MRLIDKISKDIRILGIYILENKCPRGQLNDFWDVFTFLCIQNELIDN